MNIEALNKQIKAVHEARFHAAICRETLSILRERWESDNASVIENNKEAFIQQGDAEEKLRALTLEAYAQTGSKTPALGVGIREVTKLEYDPVEAFGWAVTHEIALTLNKKAFEKFALASPASMADIVKITKEPQATIATDLSEAVRELAAENIEVSP